MFNILNNRKKEVYFDKRAIKELAKLPKLVQISFDTLIEEIEKLGCLNEPDAKKIQGQDIFEMRVKLDGIWRGFYAYLENNEIIILGFFRKKSQKTPKKEIAKISKRLINYI